MTKVLFLTTMYPNPLRPGTKVCHFFTKEWKEMGYEIVVIHIRSMFPRIFTDMARLFPGLAFRYIGNHVEMDKNMDVVSYMQEGIKCYSLPIFKYIPHGKFPKRSIDKSKNTIKIICDENGFTPDAIIGHFYNPTMELIYELKKEYPQAKSSIVFHEGPEGLKKNYHINAKQLLDSFNILGFRHKTMREEYERAFYSFDKTFICYSGTPRVFLDVYGKEPKKYYNTPIKKFLYVGQLTKNKCVKETIEALFTVYPNKDFSLTCIGDGGTAKEEIMEYINRNGLQDNILFTGRLNRHDIIRYYNQSDCFIMISRSEAFGLVYLEAMSQGCICIGTKGQGIDGVIVDGKNGFLCNGGDSKELASILVKVNHLSTEDKQRISKEARQTAERFSDYNVAKMYIDTVFAS